MIATALRSSQQWRPPILVALSQPCLQPKKQETLPSLQPPLLLPNLPLKKSFSPPPAQVSLQPPALQRQVIPLLRQSLHCPNQSHLRPRALQATVVWCVVFRWLHLLGTFHSFSRRTRTIVVKKLDIDFYITKQSLLYRLSSVKSVKSISESQALQQLLFLSFQNHL